jgi:hypothetical protein
MVTYLLVRERRASEGWGILCTRCRRISYYPPDIAARYCGQCHVFHLPVDCGAYWPTVEGKT